MNTKIGTLLITALLALSAMAFIPSASAHTCVSSNSDCNVTCNAPGTHYHRWSNSGKPGYCASAPTATIAGPGSLTVEPLFSVGVGFCHGLDPTLALACDNTGGVNGAGAYAHDTTGCTGTTNCRYDLVVEQASGSGNGGFSVSVCTDRDDSGVCTNVGSNLDDFGYTSYGAVVAGSPKTGNNFAHLDFCVRKDLSGTYDDFWVFVEAWADESLALGDSTGAGASVGTFNVYVGHAATDDATCTYTGDP